jgi:hypothetical protein
MRRSSFLWNNIPKGYWCVLVAFVLPVNVLLAGGGNPHSKAKSAEKAAFAEVVTNLYEQIDLKEMGLSKKAFEYALKGYYYLLDHHWLNKTNIISICDLSQSSRNKRLYVLDLEQRTVLVNTFVAHGRNSGKEFARTFSNNPSSHKTSLGFYITEGTYCGDNGLSLRIRGMERGINDKANGRNIVIHGSRYVGPDYLGMNQFTGRSYGCPAVPADESENIIDTIKEGSCLFIYHPTKKYIAKSKILNS